MGFLRDLYYAVMRRLDGHQAPFAASHSFSDASERRKQARADLAADLTPLERALLLTPQQQSEVSFSEEDGWGRSLPFDELEFIVKNNLSTKQYMNNARDCIEDLYEISEGDTAEETAMLRGDRMSERVINLLRRQAAQVLLLSGEDDGGRVEWLIKEPRPFLRATLLEKSEDADADAFADISFEQDLSSLQVDYHDFLLRSADSSMMAIRLADEAFNKYAFREKKNIAKYEKNALSSQGERRREYEYRKVRAEKDLARGVEYRKSALVDAFRKGEIEAYYYQNRMEQLDRGDFTRVPELFEADALKNRSAYLKEHDLHDLSKAEADAILSLARKKAERDKMIFRTKVFLMQKGLASGKRYTITEMKVEKKLLYRGYSAGQEMYEEVNVEEEVPVEGGPIRITVDLDDKGTGSGGGIASVPSTARSIRPLERRVDKK